MSDRREINPEHVVWAVVGVSLALVPHAGRFSAAMLVCFGALGLWRLLGAWDRLPLPDRHHLMLWLLKQLLAVAAFVAIYVSYRGQMGRDAGVALLSALLGLKMLEMDSERDFYIVMFLGYFLVLTNFFYSQTIQTAAFMFIVVIVITTGLVRFNVSPEALTRREAGWLSTKYILQCLPLMVIGFYLFPRVPGPLWGIPQDSATAVTGLSDEMTVGHITRLGVSDEVAFRVAFEGRVPSARDLYWRGPVLWHTDGRTWRAGDIGDGAARPVIGRGESYRYTVIMEPHRKRWLFGIDAVTYVGREGRMTSDYRVLARQPVKKRIRYTLESRTDFAFMEATDHERRVALELPFGKHPRARSLASQWRADGAADAEIVDKALSLFRRQAFIYTLTPRALTGDSVDQFLFESRQGFCEHYASAFVVLMRAAGVSARVVTGYQGGEFNTVSDYMVVRQRDAHAWAEVYLDGRGWVRVDPTAAVAPGRVSFGIGDFIGPNAPLRLISDNAVALAFWYRIRDVWDAASYGWTQWVLGYTPKRQRQLLDELGLEDWDYGTLVIALTVVTAMITLLIALLVLRAGFHSGEPVVRLYEKFCRKLARIGLHRRPYEGPQDFAARVVRRRRDLAGDVDEITRLYTAIRYAGATVSVGFLRGKVRAFAPPKAAR
jgi:transglutaminase-like putative cysteine protease